MKIVKLGKGNGLKIYKISLIKRNLIWLFICLSFLIYKERIDSLYFQLILLGNNLEKYHGFNHFLENLISFLISSKQFRNKYSFTIFNKALILFKKN